MNATTEAKLDQLKKLQTELAPVIKEREEREAKFQKTLQKEKKHLARLVRTLLSDTSENSDLITLLSTEGIEVVVDKASNRFPLRKSYKVNLRVKPNGNISK